MGDRDPSIIRISTEINMGDRDPSIWSQLLSVIWVTTKRAIIVTVMANRHSYLSNCIYMFYGKIRNTNSHTTEA